MTICKKVETQLKEAMLAKDTLRTSVLRMLKSALKYAAIEELGADGELEDPAAIQVVRKQAKQREDAIASFDAGGRADLANKERLELAILASFLPMPLSPEEITALVGRAIADTGATGKQQMGQVIKAVMAASDGRVDGKSVSAEVQKQLA